MSQYASGLSVRQPVRSIFVATHQSVALFLAAPTSNKQRHGRWNAGATPRKSSRHPDRTADRGMQHGRQSGQLLSCFMISCQAASKWSAAASFKRRGCVTWYETRCIQGAQGSSSLPSPCTSESIVFPGGKTAHVRTKSFAMLWKRWNPLTL